MTRHGAACVEQACRQRKQGAYALFDHQKDAVLVDVLKERNVKSGIVFTSRKRTVGQVVVPCARLASNADACRRPRPVEREEVMLAFRSRSCPSLATDVVSGIDIDSIELVVATTSPTRRTTFTGSAGPCPAQGGAITSD